MLCADTSFLFSLYSNDAYKGEALACLTALSQPLSLSPFNEFELANALRFAEWRGLLPAGSAAQRLEAFAEDQAYGLWQLSEIPLSEIVAEARRLSAAHTSTGGHRSFDILHVAHARLAGPKYFLSFDANQRRLAKAAGLRCK